MEINSVSSKVRRCGIPALTGLFLVAQLLLSGQGSKTIAFTCPASILVSETGGATGPWQVESPAKTEHKFLRPSLYNGAPGKQEFELVPDDEQNKDRRVQQTWKLSDYRDMNLFVRCRYAATAVTLV